MTKKRCTVYKPSSFARRICGCLVEMIPSALVTDLPAGNLSKPELDDLYRRFFEKSDEVLAEDGRMIFFSREMGLVKKQLRLHPQFRLAQEFCIQEKNGSYLFIVEKRQ